MKSITLKNGDIITLRKAKVSDAQMLLTYVNKIAGESNNLTFGEGEFTMSLKEEEDFLRSLEDKKNSLFIVAVKDEQVIANGSLMAGTRPRTKHSTTLGISVIKDYWHQGIGSEIMDYLITWAKSNETTRKINLQVKTDNINAIKLYHKYGFVREGRIDRFFLINDRFYDAYQMGLNID